MGATKHENDVKKFFSKEVLPLSKKMKTDGKVFFPTAFDANAPSYYIKRKKTTMTKADFEVAGLESYESFGKAVEEMWRAQGEPELAALAPWLARLSKELYAAEEQSGEVSPFIYVMF